MSEEKEKREDVVESLLLDWIFQCSTYVRFTDITTGMLTHICSWEWELGLNPGRMGLRCSCQI